MPEKCNNVSYRYVVVYTSSHSSITIDNYMFTIAIII